MVIDGLMNFFFLRLFFCFRTTVFSRWWQDSVLVLAKRALGERCRPLGQFKGGRSRAFPSTASLIPLRAQIHTEKLSSVVLRKVQFIQCGLI